MKLFNRFSFPLVAIAVLAFNHTATAQPAIQSTSNWHQWRGPSGMGVSSATDLPLTWAPDSNISWKTPLPGPGASSPIVYGDHIYITCYTGYGVPDESNGSLEDLKRHLIAIDQKTGDILWEKIIPAQLPEEERIRDHGYAANSPTADSEHVYVF